MRFEPLYEYKDPELHVLVNYDTLPEVVAKLAAYPGTHNCASRRVAQTIAWVYGMDFPWILHLERVLQTMELSSLSDQEYVRPWVDWYMALVSEIEDKLVAETGLMMHPDVTSYRGPWTYNPIGGGPAVKITRRTHAEAGG